RLACREPGPRAGPAVRRGADVEADALRRVAASAEDEMAYLDLPAAHGAETDVKAGAAGARGPAVHDMPPRADVTTRAPLGRWPAVDRSCPLPRPESGSIYPRPYNDQQRPLFRTLPRGPASRMSPSTAVATSPTAAATGEVRPVPWVRS